jgi:hypothetical protein
VLGAGGVRRPIRRVPSTLPRPRPCCWHPLEFAPPGARDHTLIHTWQPSAQLERDLMDEKRRDGIAAARQWRQVWPAAAGEPQVADRSRGVEGKRRRHARDCPPAKSGSLDDLRLLAEQKERAVAGGPSKNTARRAMTANSDGAPRHRHATLQGGEIRDTKASVASFAGGAASEP